LEDADPFYGDTLAARISWQGRTDLSPLIGRTVRLRFVLQDADLFAMTTVP
jgi:hypothetical protein